MPKMIVSIDGVVIKEVQLTKDKTTLGRRPYNDIVIDNLAISGEHAIFEVQGSQVYLEDMDSTNGTYVNGKAAKRLLLQHGDLIDVGKYKIKFDDQSEATAPAGQAPTKLSDLPVTATAFIKGLSGAAAGREVPLSKMVTTVGKPGVAVAAITRRHGGFFVHHVEGAGNPSLNGAPFGFEPTALKNGDVIELAGTQMQFVHS
jgi:hypothetical protein